MIKPILIKKHVDITKPPTAKDILKNTTGTYVIGDLHGNALKLFHTLCVIGILKVSKKTYQEFVDMYFSDHENIDHATLEYYAEFFRKIIENTKCRGKHPYIIFAGDEVGDRGRSDFLTLQILRVLYNIEVFYRICISNHGFEFINAYETLDFKPLIIGGDQACSLKVLDKIITDKLTTPASLLQLIYCVYRQHLVVYETVMHGKYDHPKGMVFISHAPIGFEVINNINKQYNLNHYINHCYLVNNKWYECYDEVCHNLYRYFQMKYFNKNLFHTLVGPGAAMKGLSKFRISQDGNPLELLMWNRNADLDRPSQDDHQQLYWVHGHDSRQWDEQPHVINLDHDNWLGKTDEAVTGNLNLVYIAPE